MNLKALSLGVVVGFLVALSPSCGGTSQCSASNCAGCCDASGMCVTTTTAVACGASGNVCKSCSAGESCVSGVCTAGGTATDAGTDGGPGTQAPSSCPTGCFAGGVCVLGKSVNNCGTGGVVCDVCDTAAGETCTNQVCTVPDAGPLGAGSLGSACTQDSDCNVNGGNPSRCKLTTSQGNLQYKGGYCTRRCYEDSQCGENGMCVYALGPFGEAENICVLKCDAQTPCPRTDGYICLNFGTQQNPQSGCFIDDTASANPYPQIDAGPGAGPGVTGSSCTDNAQCQPPSSGFCITEDQGYPGGSCTSDCSLALTDDYCGTGGRCNLYLAELAAGQDPFVIGLCEQGCNADGGSSCRTDYACEPRQGGRDICTPRCDLSSGGIACPQGQTCVNGLCQ